MTTHENMPGEIFAQEPHWRHTGGMWHPWASGHSIKYIRADLAARPAEVTVDALALVLCKSFYSKGHIYDNTMEEVVHHRWKEWRQEANSILYAFPHNIRIVP